MQQQDLVNLLEFTGKDPTRLVFEDELTSIYNRRFLFQYFQTKVVWEKLAQNPLSLIMIDVDNFKNVNDSHGHQVGDAALVWVADLLREVGGDEGLSIRYAGDEFMLLLAHCDKQAAMKIGNRLLDKVRAKPFRPDDQKKDLLITLSIGIASAPEDAQSGKGLIQKADLALYSAKCIGRDCQVDAGEVNPETVFDKTVVNQLKEVKLVGRDPQFKDVIKVLNKFGQNQNQMLIAEGAAGIGKSEFLESIRRGLARTKAWHVKVSGDSQEMFRPYYLMAGILVKLLGLHGDQGADLIASLDNEHQVHIARIFPQLAPDVAAVEDDGGRTDRKGIFSALAHLFIKVAGSRPIILFLDDLHFADEASLVLLRHLIQLKKLSLCVLATAESDPESARAEHKIPLRRFCELYQEPLGIQKLTLTPLGTADIAKHMDSLFPNISIPADFENELARISQGNPLFINELLRKLVFDRKITLSGQQWTIEPPEDGYFPKTLEEIVSHKITALDEESRLILDQISALGGDVSLSMLVGSSEQREAKVLEFIDKASDQGLISTNFQLNDEMISILGKQVLAITYGSIEPGRRQALHEQIGNYQEDLYEKHILPSAATLAYHFKRSTNQQKAGHYERIQTLANSRNFNGQEAMSYSEAASGEATEANVPLKSRDFKRIPEILRDFMVAVRNIKLYPPGSKSIVKINRQFKASLERVLQDNEILNIVQVKNAILANGQKLDASEFKLVADTFLKLLDRTELKGIAFHRGLTEQELEVLLQALGNTLKKTFAAGFWEEFSAEHQLTNIELKQVQYSMKVKSASGAVQGAATAAVPVELTAAQAAESTAPLGPQELKIIPEILRALVAAARVISLYPLKSKSVVNTLNTLLRKLQQFFTLQHVLVFSQAGDTLLVNGEKLDTSGPTELRGLTDNFKSLLDKIGLESLTFLETISIHQLEAFIGALGKLPESGVNSDFWKTLAQEQGLSAIVFDQQLYEIQVATSLSAGRFEPLAVGHPRMIPQGPRNEPIAPQQFLKYLEQLPKQVHELFVDGKPAIVEQAVNRVYPGLQEREIGMRKKVIDLWRKLLDGLTPAYQYDFAKVLMDPLIIELGIEKEPKMVVEMAALLSRMATLFIQFADYPLASRALAHIEKQFQIFKNAKDPNAQLFAGSMNRKLDSQAQRVLIEDLKSADPERQRNAAQLLGSLGAAANSMLIEIIKGEDDFRTRQIAAGMLAKLGPKAVERIKHLMVLEISAQERARILGVIDILTTDLKIELFHALGDEDADLRQAAYRLVERLQDSRVIGWLQEFLQSPNPALAVSAVKCLGNLRPPNIEAELVALLNSTEDIQLRVACCRALGQIASPMSVDVLRKLLLPSRAFIFRKKQDSRVREAAAYALGQISHPEASQSLLRFVDDRDPAVQEIARQAQASTTAISGSAG